MVRIYNKSLKLEALLQNAFDIGYNKPLKDIWSAQFSLPANDPKNEDCLTFNFAEIYDDNERVDLFRIMSSDKSMDSKTVTYRCEHVLGTLLDDTLFQYHQTTGLSPSSNISYILEAQSIKRWEVGKIDALDIYSYKWENENLLAALFSLIKPYAADYYWTWDTKVYPWKLNLKLLPTEYSAVIRYKKNLINIQKVSDTSYLRTRLYCLGAGEGVNQTNIKSVNNGIPYIDSDTIEEYGIITDYFIDKTEENPVALKAKAMTYLNSIKTPKISYEVSAADIYQITEEPIDRFRDPGIIVKVYDDENGEFDAIVVNVCKRDLKGDPGRIDINIGSTVLGLSDSTATLQRAKKINEVYAQGATNIDSNDYQDNCDSEHPATIEFYIPEECIKINKCMLSYKTEKFRAYERLLESVPESSQTSSSGGNAIATSGGNDWWTESAYSSAMAVTNFELEGDNRHAHIIKGVNHSHDIDIPSHTHEVIIPEHTHEIKYGIFEYSNLPTQVTIKVDGNTIPQTSLTGNDIDIIPYLSSNGGKIIRGTFHKVEIFPNETTQNPLGLSRVAATVIKQIFLQSRGEGEY